MESVTESKLEKSIEGISEEDIKAMCRMTLSIARVSGKRKDLSTFSFPFGVPQYDPHYQYTANKVGFQFFSDSTWPGLPNTYRISEKKNWWKKPGQVLFEVKAKNDFEEMEIITCVPGNWQEKITSIHNEYGFGNPYE